MPPCRAGLAFVTGLALLAQACATSAESSPTPAVGTAPTPLALAAQEPPSVEPSPSSVPVAPPTQAAPAPKTCEMFVEPGVIKRAALVRLIDGGIPRWLQGAEGDRVLANHRFQGWLVKSLHPTDPCYQAIDLRPGDIVQKINGKPIERPEQAFDVVESLRTAPAIVVDYLRNGKPQRLSIAVQDAGAH